MVSSFRIPQAQFAELCRKHHIRRASLFGSALRPDFSQASDVDLLIEFEAGKTPGWEIVDIEQEFSTILGGRRVDLVNPKYLNPLLRDRILNSAVVQYDSDHAS